MSTDQELVRILGDYREFYTQQSQRLKQLGINITGFEVSHLAFRTETLQEYLLVRQRLEIFCSANVENEWSGRPISKLLLQEPLQLAPDATTSLIELIPPLHQEEYKMGLEHIGIVLGNAFADFETTHAHVFSGQQDQGPFCQPYFITFPDLTNVKFYRYSLMEVCVLEGKRFNDFYHVID